MISDFARLKPGMDAKIKLFDVLMLTSDAEFDLTPVSAFLITILPSTLPATIESAISVVESLEKTQAF